jgi:hypothetical protein
MTTTVDGSLGVTFPAGGNPQVAPASVIQTVNFFSSSSSTATTTNTTWTSTGYSVTITPKFATSKIFIIATSNVGSAASGSCYYTLFRNSTNLANGTAPTAMASFRNNTTGASPVLPCTMQTLDSPATTSATTYTVYFFANSGNTAYWNIGNSDLQSMSTSLVAMEIAA